MRIPSRLPRSLASALLLSTAAAACAREPVDWNDAADRRVPLPPPSAAAPGDPIAERAALRRLVRGVVGEGVDSAAVVSDPSGGRACPGSLAVARGHGAARAAAWWELRADGTAALLSTNSADGGQTWARPVPVDTLDRGATRCERPAPSVALDSAYYWTHVAYSMSAPEGKGVFYAHRMSIDGPFEPPIVVVYGDRPAQTSVDARQHTVVVAYEDPNVGDRTRVSLALSRADGHVFDARTVVSGTSSSADAPQVALGPRGVAVGWVEKIVPRIDDPSVDRAELPAQARAFVVRSGAIR